MLELGEVIHVYSLYQLKELKSETRSKVYM